MIEYLFYADLDPALVAAPVALCAGDAHPLNFGTTVGPAERAAFAAIDFAEAAWAPCSCDLARLASGLVLLWPVDQQDLMAGMVDGYRAGLDRAYRSEPRPLVAAYTRGLVRQLINDAEERSQRRFWSRTLEEGHDLLKRGPGIEPQPPELKQALLAQLDRMEQTRAIRHRLAVLDVVRSREYGSGSVGHRSYRALLEELGDAGRRFRVLEFRERRPSVLEPLSPDDRAPFHVRQLSGFCADPWLSAVEIAGLEYWVHQRGAYTSFIDPRWLLPKQRRAYARACGLVLGLGHGRASPGFGRQVRERFGGTALRRELGACAEVAMANTEADVALFRSLLKSGGLG